MSCHMVKIKKFTMLFGFPPTVYRIVASSPFLPNILLLHLLSRTTHSKLLMIFSQMESVYPQAWSDKHQGVLQTPSFWGLTKMGKFGM